ncbi:MAG TPA: hypothetical protein DCS87_06205 [Rheinheimera sp.]|nr:hypothetical protein [Rheinheimera sp.]
MLGIIEGTIYGYAIHNSDGSFCLAGTPKEQVRAIAKTIGAATARGDEIQMEDVPSKESSMKFLRAYFPCKTSKP